MHRPRDFIGRFGGEEFVLILPETDELSAKQIAEKCRLLIQQQQIPHESSDVSDMLTISLGVGTITPGMADDKKAFVEAVDQCLYKAKDMGRDCLFSESA